MHSMLLLALLPWLRAVNAIPAPRATHRLLAGSKRKPTASGSTGSESLGARPVMRPVRVHVTEVRPRAQRTWHVCRYSRNHEKKHATAVVLGGKKKLVTCRAAG